MSIEKRNPLFAALLSLVSPGLGQIYNGQPLKGILFFVAGSMLQVILLVLGLQYRLFGMLIILFLGLSTYLFIAAEAFLTAQRLGQASLRFFNRWYYYLLFAIFAIGTGSIASHLFDIEPLKNSSGSMTPTLMIDDRLIINTSYYNKNTPGKSDVIIFRSPKDQSQCSVKRIIATEDDIIELKDKKLYLNGAVLNEPYVQHDDSEIRSKDAGPRDNFGPLTIKKGAVFFMGDNRDQSYDSRFYGLIEKNQIKGRALYIYWSKNTERIGKPIR